MKIKKIHTIGFLLLFILSNSLSAQVFYNNGAQIFTATGAILKVAGTAQNNTGTFDNNGTTTIDIDYINNATTQGNGIYQVAGNWQNNLTFTNGTSLVQLNGGNQLITGTAVTTFNDLELLGTGIKTQTINARIGTVGTLILNDRELATDANTLFIDNTSVASITRTTGFVSSLIGGNLSRATASTNTYIFPTGSGIGTARYRPIDILPTATASNIFSVRMANVDATTEGYDRTLLQAGICSVEPDFFHLIDQTSGTTPADITIYYDPIQDGFWNGIAQWESILEWQTVGTVTNAIGIPFNSIQVANWSDYITNPFILTNAPPIVSLGNDTTLCAPNSVTLDAGNVGATFIWQDGSTNQTFTANSAGTYYVDVNNGFCTRTDTLVVTTSILNVNLGSDTVLCGINSLVLDAGNVGSTFLWQDGSTNQNLTTNGSGTYFVNVNNGICTSTDTIVVTNSVLNVNLGNDTTLCASNSVTLDAGNIGSTFIWQDGSFNQTFTASTAGIYYVDVNNGFCTKRDSLVVTTSVLNVNLGNDTTLCGSNSIVLDAENVGSTFLWQNGTTNQTLATMNAGTYYVNVDNGICVVTDTLIITITVPTVNLGNDTTICLGNSVILDAGNVGAIFLWQDGATNQTFTVNTTGTYYVDVNDGVCIGTDTITITTSSITVNLGNDTTLCVGNSLTLNAGNPGSTFTWQNSTTNQTFIANNAGTYYVNVDNGVCIATDTITVSASTLSVNLGNDTLFCIGNTIVLNAGNTGSTFEWQDASTNQTFTATVTGIYYVDVLDGLCTVSDTIIVNIVSSTDATITQVGPYCSNASPVNLTTVTTGGLWTGTGITNVLTGLFDPSLAGIGTHQIIYTIAGSCGNADTINIVVNSCAVPSAAFTTAQTNFCEGTCITFTDLSVSTAPGGLTAWAWDFGNGQTSTSQSPINICYNTAGSYTVTLTVTDINGNATATTNNYIIVTVCTPPTASFSFTNSICAGDCISITDLSTAGTTWQWTFNSAIPSSSTSQNPGTICYNTSGSYSIELITTNVFGADTSIQTITVNDLPLIDAGVDQIIDLGTSAILDGTGSSGNYLWSPNTAIDCGNCLSTTATPTTDITYGLTVTDVNGCVATDSILITVNVLDAIGVPNAFSPNGDLNNDELFVKGGGVKSIIFIVFNRYGEKVFETSDQSIGWDGNFKGKIENTGVFAYYLEYVLINGDSGMLKGNVTLIR